MIIDRLCAPAFIYAIFTVTQILMDLYYGEIDTVVTKSIALVVFTYLLNLLCEMGLGPISWVIVFVPFIFTSLITFIVITNIGSSLLTK
jgi:hypothetical protein